jgi:ornithine cyclodeaminase/alanine dehydrogenase-like protein (mu-crystallin family)
MSRRHEHASAFMTHIAPTLPEGCVTAIGGDAERLVAEHDIVCTATASPTPIITTLPEHRTMHVCCMGAHAEDRREVDHTLLARTLTICEDIGLAVAEAGDVHAGALDIGAMLRTDRSTLRRTSTIFSSTGDPFADLVTMAYVLDTTRSRVTAVV